MMKGIDTRGLLVRIFTPTIALSLCYLLLGCFCNIPHILLFCILGTLIALIFFGVAGLLSAFIAPVENQLFAGMRTSVLDHLPTGFDWTDYEYQKSFSRPIQNI